MSDETPPHADPSGQHQASGDDAPTRPRNGKPGGRKGGGRRGGRGQRQGDRPKRRDVNGWVILDKGVGMTSTQAVGMVKRCFNAKKAGHAGTLDPLASGLLPIALGEATKTVPFVMDGRKAYVFTVTWGVETDTDDAEGNVVDRTDTIPDRADVEALLPKFTGLIMQTPPQFSAIKIQGERAYDLAREGEQVALQPRPVEIDRLTLLHHAEGKSVFEAECGKGTYVRALARDMGRELGCLGHITALRRTRVGPFTEEDAVEPVEIEAMAEVSVGTEPVDFGDLILPVQSALDEVEEVPVSRDAAARIMRGQSAILRGRDAPIEGQVFVSLAGTLVAVGDVENGEFVPHRVFHLGAF
ncbi:MAG: tRNA pseudouridine(55) synthase TruB [Salinarimonas sp.]|nr:tRNA pseudouridine(55) synthase TruB [Salinarimonas sp.]